MAAPERRYYVGDVVRSIGRSSEVLALDINRTPRPMPEVGVGETGVQQFIGELRGAHFPYLANTLEAVNPAGRTLAELSTRPARTEFRRQSAVIGDLAITLGANEHSMNRLIGSPRREPDWYRGPATRRADLVLTYYELLSRAVAEGDEFLLPAAHRAHTLAAQPEFTLSEMMEQSLLRRVITSDELVSHGEHQEDPRRALRTMEDVSRLIDVQSANRMGPYTGNRPFAYAQVTEDGGQTWTTTQIVGDGLAKVGVPEYQFGFNGGKQGFLAHKEVILKPDDPKQYSVHDPNVRETRASFAITQDWVEDPQHAIRAVPAETASGRTFSDGAVQDLTLLTPGELVARRDNILNRGLTDVIFDVDRESRTLVDIAKAMSFQGEHTEAAELIRTIVTDFPDYQIHPDHLTDIIVINNIFRSRALRSSN